MHFLIMLLNYRHGCSYPANDKLQENAVAMQTTSEPIISVYFRV